MEILAVLSEAKIDQFIQKHENSPQAKAYFEELKILQTPPKYLSFLEKITLGKISAVNPSQNQAMDWADQDYNIVTHFEKLLGANQIPPDKKDIGKYNSRDELVDVVNQAEADYKKKQLQKVKSGDQIKHFENDTYLIIEPKTEGSSCKYGSNTRWCISATDTTNYFQEYSDQGLRFLFVVNKKTDDKDAVSVHPRLKQIEIYDARDVEKKISYIDAKYPTEVLEALNKVVLSISGFSPFSLINYHEVSNNLEYLLTHPGVQFLSGRVTASPREAVELLVKLSREKDSWPSDKKDPAEAVMRLTLVKFLNVLLNTPEEFKFQDYQPWRLLQVAKNTGIPVMPLHLSLLKALAWKETFPWRNGLYIMILLFVEPQKVKQNLEWFFKNPQDPDSYVFVENIKRLVDNIYDRLGGSKLGTQFRDYYSGLLDHKNNPDRAYIFFQKIYDHGNSVGWNFDSELETPR